ncbi:hypothetical protein [Nostoc piscinale]|nr:hypothetical protein [Nostoc piscinale]
MWLDFYSNQDWLCTKTPVTEGCDPTKISHRKLKFTLPLSKQINGQSHDNYFINEEVLKAVLNLKASEYI